MPRLSAEEQLILFSAGTQARRRATLGKAEKLAAIADWRRLTELLRTWRLLPTVGPRVVRLFGDQASAEFELAVARALELGRRHGAFLQMIAARVMGELADAGIRSTALKGPLLSEAIYGDPGRRPSSDIDLLVSQEQLSEAVGIVRRMGYAAPTDYVGDSGLPVLHFALGHERDELPPVELHWRIHWYESRFARDRLLAPSCDLSSGWRPAPVDELTALLLFYARDGFIGLRHAVDIGAWWDRFGDRLQAGAIDESVCTYKALEPALLVAARVAERTVGLPAGQLIEDRKQLSARGRIAVRLADPYPRSSEAQLYADMGLIDGLLAPPGGFHAYVKRQVTPPREAMSEHLRRAGKRGRTSTAGRAVRVLGRYGLAMIRLLRTTQAMPSR